MKTRSEQEMLDPNIPDIIKSAEKAGFLSYKTDRKYRHTISDDFIKLVENKGFSIFHLTSDAEYESGLAYLKDDFNKQVEIEYEQGETFIWLKK